jgi:hypothetical protein
MTTQFLSRVERDVNKQEVQVTAAIGPGAYEKQSALSRTLPGFAPFASSASQFPISLFIFQ